MFVKRADMTEENYITEINRLRSQMVEVATRYLDNHDEAEDITQDALLKLWAMREILRESEVDRLAFTILKHLCVNELKRREYRRANLSVDIDSIDVAMETDNPHEIEEREQQLMAAVNKLPSRQRLLLEMRYIKGKDVRTISALTGSSEESINMALSRARSKVYKIMAAVVVAVVCIGLFVFSFGDTDEPAAVQSADNRVENPESVNVAAEGHARKGVAVLSEEDDKRPANLPRRSQMVADNRRPAPRRGALANSGDAPQEAASAAPAVADDESESLDRDMMQAILESSAPEKVYASQSQLPDADVSNRDRLRKKTLAIITLNE